MVRITHAITKREINMPNNVVFKVLILKLFSLLFIVDVGYAKKLLNLEGVYELERDPSSQPIPYKQPEDYKAWLIIKDEGSFSFIDSVEKKNNMLEAKALCEGEYYFDGDLFDGDMYCPTAFDKIAKLVSYRINLMDVTRNQLKKGVPVIVTSNLFTFRNDLSVTFTMRQIENPFKD